LQKGFHQSKLSQVVSRGNSVKIALLSSGFKVVTSFSTADFELRIADWQMRVTSNPQSAIHNPQ